MAVSGRVKALVAAGVTSLAIATAFLADKEGVEFNAYLDTGKVWTICMGHTATAHKGMAATPQECDELFKQEYPKYEAAVTSTIKVPMTEARKAALASFCYNVGIAACKGSTLFKRINERVATACDELLKWTKVRINGTLRDCHDRKWNCYGIVERREDERELCQS